MVKPKKNKPIDNDSEEDETLYYRCNSFPQETSSSAGNQSSKKTNGSGGLAPSKSTVYISNIDYSLTNSDLHTIFSVFGKVAKVTVLKDRFTRQSRGVAFVLYVSREDAQKAAKEMDGKVLNGRKLTASIAVDNGRAAEFIRKRVYVDKSKCYECGGEGHLSYECPRNQLGPRERPIVPKRKGKGGGSGGDVGRRREEEEEGEEEVEEENWASVVDGGAGERLLMGERMGGDRGMKKAKKASYFSDESDEED